MSNGSRDMARTKVAGKKNEHRQSHKASLTGIANNNKVDVQFPYISVWKLLTQACEIVAVRMREQSKKFQVYICKTKKDRSAHAQLHSL